MGVRGLTNYIHINSHLFLRNYNLHDTFLVIDGNSLASQLYLQGIKCNYCFGGDYDKYANYVSSFFDNLLKCNITPVIIIDGAYEDKKISTIYKRLKDKIHSASIADPARQAQTSLFPLMLMDVFKCVIERKNLKLSQSLFEADIHVASIAKILNCPVLSSDSDFFIFDVMYIPFDTLFYGTVRNGNKFIKSCKMYKFDHVLQSYPGIDKTVMPIAAILIGNDYIDKIVFQDFLSTLKLNKRNIKKYNPHQEKIDAIFTWLQKETLDSAIKTIMNKIKPEESESILELMEMIINGYFHVTPIMLHSLGFSKTFLNSLENISYMCYKYQNPPKINIIKLIDDLNCDSIIENSNILLPKDEIYLYKLMPPWFINALYTAKLGTYFITMITKQIYICPVQVEDFSQPTCINISLKIISMIFCLLTSGVLESKPVLNYITRGKSTNIVTCKLKCESTLISSLPSLLQLPDLSPTEKREILNQTLGLTDTLLDIFPSEWKLYMGVIKYWMNEAEEEFCTKCHLYCLLFAMLYHVVDKNIEFFCRKELNFKQKYGDFINSIQSSKMKSNPLSDMSIQDALINVNKQDCVLAMPFFLKNFNMSKDLVINSKKFCVAIVHAFSLFQNCLKYTMNLNALLNFPYQHTNVSELFNGTLLYNLYNSFKHRQDIDIYISTILQNSPSLLQLFTSILKSAQILCPVKLNCQINQKSNSKNQNIDVNLQVKLQRRIRHKKKNTLDDDDYVEEEDLVNRTPYYDPNNKFTLLNNEYLQ